MKQIFCTYSTVTAESSEHGDTAENGWYDDGWKSDDRPETGYNCTPENSEDDTAITLAVRYLKSKWICDPSSSFFHAGIWYSTEYQVEDYSTGESIQYDYHLEGFTRDEQFHIFNTLFPKRF